MEYEKTKINRLIEYKDKVINQDIKNDLEWILEQYNEYYINNKDFEYREKTYKDLLKKYYNVEDEKTNLKEQLIMFKRKVKVLTEAYNQLKTKCKQSCKKHKSMI